MIIYDSCDLYIEKAKTLRDKVIAIDAVVDALMLTMVKAAVSENLTEYILDDGQTKIQCNYRGVDAITRSIKGLETIKHMYINRINGRIVRLQDGKSFGNQNYNNGRS